MIVHQDEVLDKALASDTEVIPRYDIVAVDGTVIAPNVQLTLKNPILKQGTLFNKAYMDELLAAKNVTAGTATAYTLSQPQFALVDGACVRFKLHVDSGATPTLNVNLTGAKKLMVSSTKPMRAGVAAGTWLTAIYSSTFDFFVLQGSNASTERYGNDVGQVSTFELAMHGFSPFYRR